MFEQGDVLIVKFPFTNLTQSKWRPVLVLSGSNVNSGEDLVCVQITTKVFPTLFKKLKSDAVSPPLLLESGIRLQKIFTIEKTLIREKIGVMNAGVFAEILAAINTEVFSK
jgi:mRNA interferase MazF